MRGAAGAAMMPTAAQVANGTYTFAASYDGDLRNTDEKLATGGGTTVYAQTHGYDAVGNVTSADTTLPAGTDNQTFCYDDEDRLVWASGATGTGPCGAANTAGTLGAAAYAQSYTYDALDRMTTGPAGSFTYGPGMQAGSGAAPLHGVTALGAASYSYDAAGDRTDAGATTGDAYDAERRLVSWTAGGVTGKEAYDGEGQRVAHQTTSGVTTTTTYYVGGVEEIDAASGTITKYYPMSGGLPEAVRAGATLSYLARDGLGSVSAALDGSGNATATALYAPYGQVRYSSGTMPTTKGYTGQRADAASGLNYYGARYYDPSVDQFASADTVADGLNRFAYVGDSPEARVDPTGKDWSWVPSASTIVGVVAGILNPLAKGVSKAAQVAQGVEQTRYNILRSLNSSGGAVPTDQIAARTTARQTADTLGEASGEADAAAGGMRGAGYGAIAVAGAYDFVTASAHQWNSDTKYQSDPTMRAIRAYDAGTFRAFADVGSAVTAAAIGGQVGEVGGVVTGYLLGGALGAIAGALVGTALEPGGGTLAGGAAGWELGSEAGADLGGPLGSLLGSAYAGYQEGTNPWWQGQLDNATTNFVNSVTPAEQGAETAIENGAVNLGSAVVGWLGGL